MNSLVENIINREILEIEYPDINTAIRMEPELREILNSEMPDLILNSYKKHFNSEWALRIDKLVLSLGEIELSEFKHNFLKLFSASIDKKFIALARQIKEQQLPSLPDSEKFTDNIYPDKNIFQKDFSKGAQSLGKDTDSLLLLQSYFFTGTLPWWVNNNKEFPLKELIFDLLKNRRRNTVLLLAKIFQNKFSSQRFVQNFSTEEVQNIIYHIIEDIEEPYKNIFFQLKQSAANNYAAQIIVLILCLSFFSKKTSEFSLKILIQEYFTLCNATNIILHSQSLQKFFIYIFETLKIKSSILNDSEISQILALLLEISAQYNFEMRAILKPSLLVENTRLLNYITELKFTSPLLFENFSSRQQKYLNVLIEIYNSSRNTVELRTKLEVEKFSRAEIKLNNNIPLSASDVSVEDVITNLPEILKNKFPKLFGTTLPEKDIIKISQDSKSDVTGEKFYIENAGLCLIAPFLPAFFKKIKYLKDGSFISTDIQKRAAHLLQGITNPDDSIGEHRMLLNKLLCGIPFEMPLLKNFQVHKYELEEIELLLNSVIQNWSALKNTSVEGFRSSFLLRNGVLSLNETQWNLQLERKPYDVILETLPWNISIIKFKWMDKLINIEW